MRTFKRNMSEIDTSIANTTKYFNQMEFKGIVEDDNIYALDQQSFRDAKNIYADSTGRLVSRKTLQVDELPEEIKTALYDADLIDIKTYGDVNIYVIKSNSSGLYSVIANGKFPTSDNVYNYELDSLTEYHICSLEQYIICFNDINAKIIDTNRLENGWKDLTEFAEIPVTKSVTGPNVNIYQKNDLIPNLYKERYLLTKELYTPLPDLNVSADVEVNSASGKINETLYNPAKATEYRILQPIATNNLSNIDPRNISAAKSIVCLAFDKYVKISYNYGKTFSNVYYPNYTGAFHLGTISEDGLYYFFVATEGVFRYNLSDKTWSNIFKGPDGSNLVGYRTNFNYPYSFKNSNTFAFVLRNDNEVRLYFKGPGLYTSDDYTDDHMDATNIDKYYKLLYIDSINSTSLYSLMSNTITSSSDNNTKFKLKLNVVEDLTKKYVTELIMTWQSPDSSHLYSINDIIYILGGDTSNISQSTKLLTRSFRTTNEVTNITLIDVTNTILTSNTFTSIVDAIWYDNQTLHKFVRGTITITNTSIKFDIKLELPFNSTNLESPLPLLNGYIYREHVASNSDLISRTLPNINDKEFYKVAYNYCNTCIIDNDIFYILGYYNDELVLWTNALYEDTSAQITYTIGKADAFTKVPQVTYSDTELYLAFDNLLQITNNAKDGIDIKFNLPAINNQSFIENITAMTNISTTEVALFFKDDIKICSKVSDENYSFRYDYYNTKLSTGVRLGDSVINTLEGSYTIFPTLRGLAVMNYQAFMATSDQVIEYMTNDQKELWTAFYNNSSQIRIIQWRNKLILTNNTEQILMYDLNNQAWWRLEVPVQVLIALTDQIDLRLIYKELLIFKDANLYYDFSETGNLIPIDWFVQSQPLHFNAPTYYKNIKQLVFQLANSSNIESDEKSMLAQIKLYRKRVTVRTPEEVAFEIEQSRTFVKRFNYWKINELQWVIASNEDVSNPKPLELNGISVKYEIGEEVR